MNIDPTTVVGQMRLNTGDFIEEEPYLEDSVYLFYYQSNGNSIIDGSIEALESIINYVALSPQSWTLGGAHEQTASVAALTRRLETLRTKKSNSVMPMLIRTDRKNWDDFDKAFGNK